MRKFLLAGAAVIGSVGMASAQAPAPAPMPMPMGVYGMPGAPTPYLGGNNSNNSQGAPAAPGPTAPTPGSFVVHLNGRMFMYFALSGSTANSTSYVQTTTAAATTTPQVIPWATAHDATLYSNHNGVYNPSGKALTGLVKGDTYNFFHGTGSSAGGLWAVTTNPKPVTTVTTNKLNPQQFLGYFRMYPGLDAEATNGLRYGGIVEIRQNFIGASQGSGSSASPAAGLAGANAQNEGASASGNSSGSTLYVRREAAYVGSDAVGIFRFGQDDGPFSQFDNGVTTFQFGDGAWNGDLPSAIPTNAQPTFPFWSGVGKEYAVSKGVYLSPQFAGFDFAASYAPGTNANSDTACNVAFSGCSALSSSSTAGDEARATNWFELMARYQATFNGFGIYGIAGYSGSGNVSASSPLTNANLYKNFSVGDFGLVLSYAGFSVGGNVLVGQYEGQVALTYAGGKNSVAWVAGASYTNGPISVGASYFNMQSQGSNIANPGVSSGSASTGAITTVSTTNGSGFISQRYDEGFAANVTYAVAPGMNAFVSALWGEAHQGGVDLLSGQSVAAMRQAGYTSGWKETVSGQAFMVGTQIKW